MKREIAGTKGRVPVTATAGITVTAVNLKKGKGREVNTGSNLRVPRRRVRFTIDADGENHKKNKTGVGSLVVEGTTRMTASGVARERTRRRRTVAEGRIGGIGLRMTVGERGRRLRKKRVREFV